MDAFLEMVMIKFDADSVSIFPKSRLSFQCGRPWLMPSILKGPQEKSASKQK